MTGTAELTTTNAINIIYADVRNAVSFCAAQYLMFPLTTIVLSQFIRYLKHLRELLLESMSWFQLDGEATQIECYRSINLNILHTLNEEQIVIGKPSANTTQISQP